MSEMARAAKPRGFRCLRGGLGTSEGLVESLEDLSEPSERFGMKLRAGDAGNEGGKCGSHLRRSSCQIPELLSGSNLL